MKDVLKNLVAVVVLMITCVVALVTLVVAGIEWVLSATGEALCHVTDRLLNIQPEEEETDNSEEVPA